MLIITLLLPAPSGVFSSEVLAAALAGGVAVAPMCAYVYTYIRLSNDAFIHNHIHCIVYKYTTFII